MLDTRAGGNTQALRNCLAEYGATSEPGDLRWWQEQRAAITCTTAISENAMFWPHVLANSHPAGEI
jgi:hypothetical protein